MYVPPPIFFFLFLILFIHSALVISLFLLGMCEISKDVTFSFLFLFFFYQLSTLEIRLDLINQNQGVDWIGLDWTHLKKWSLIRLKPGSLFFRKI